MAEVVEIDDELVELRTDLVNAIFELVPRSGSEQRRKLLDIKRDCFHGRPLAEHVGDPVYQLLPEALAGRVVELETRLGRAEEELDILFAAEETRQVQHLLELSKEDGLRRGLALASPVLCAHLDRVRPVCLTDQNRKATGLGVSLLRYVTRAGYKCSPFSTLTRLAYGEISGEGRDGAGLAMDRDDWTACSTVSTSLRFSQIWQTLARHRVIRDGLEVELNDTVVDQGDHQVRLLRPGRWGFDDEGKLRFFHESLVVTRLRGPLVDAVRRALTDGPRPLGSLVDQLARGSELETDEVRGWVEQLLEVGFIIFRSPCDDLSDQKARCLLDRLQERSLPDELSPVITALREVADLEAEFIEAEQPSEVAAAYRVAVGQLWQVVGRVGTGGAVRRQDSGEGQLYEDVFLQVAESDRSDGTTHRGIGTLPVPTARRILAAARPLHRLTWLFDRRFEFLHSLDELLAERRPDRHRVGLLESLDDVLPLWQRYNKKVPRFPRGVPEEAFDPSGSEAIARLQTVRRRVWGELAEAMAGSGPQNEEVRRVEPGSVERIIERVPDIYRPIGGCCLFLQPVDATGDQWVMNRMFEGTGRYSSRYTRMMDPAAFDHHQRCFASASTFEVGGERVEMLDLLRVRDNPLNLHAVQTPRVLDLPGETTELTAEMRVLLSDLSIERDPAGGLPRLVDRRGHRLCPVHMGHVNHHHLPPLLKLLLLFGPSGLQFQLPMPELVDHDGVFHSPRLEVGALVVRRRRWWIKAGELAERIEAPSGSGVLRALSTFRREHGIPARFFWIETIRRQGGSFYKPQYFDATSPVYLHLLRSTLKSHDDDTYLGIAEPLPSPEAFVTTRPGHRWATEIQLDSLACGGAGWD